MENKQYLVGSYKPCYPQQGKKYFANRISAKYNAWDSVPATMMKIKIIDAANMKEAIQKFKAVEG